MPESENVQQFVLDNSFCHAINACKIYKYRRFRGFLNLHIRSCKMWIVEMHLFLCVDGCVRAFYPSQNPYDLNHVFSGAVRSPSLTRTKARLYRVRFYLKISRLLPSDTFLLVQSEGRPTVESHLFPG
jgi:hypothetical protein